MGKALRRQRIVSHGGKIKRRVERGGADDEEDWGGVMGWGGTTRRLQKNWDIPQSPNPHALILHFYDIPS
jgi:hypothetical protein